MEKNVDFDALLTEAAKEDIDFIEALEKPSLPAKQEASDPAAKQEESVDLFKAAKKEPIDFIQAKPMIALYIAAISSAIGLFLLPFAGSGAPVLFVSGLFFALAAGCIGGHFITGDAGLDGSFDQSGTWTVRAIGGAAFFLIVFLAWLVLIVWPISSANHSDQQKNDQQKIEQQKYK